MLELTCSVTIYVPSNDYEGHPIENRCYIQDLLEQMAKRFGGVTVTEGHGRWMIGNRPIDDDITKLTAYCTPKDLVDYRRDVLPSVIATLKEDLRQDSIAVEFTTGNTLQLW